MGSRERQRKEEIEKVSKRYREKVLNKDRERVRDIKKE